MAIEHYSSLASNRNYKIHNASKRALRALAYMYRRAGDALGTKPTSTNKITLYLHPANYSQIVDTNLKFLIDYIISKELELLMKICVTVYARV